MTVVFPEPDEFAKAHPFTASAQIDPYWSPPWAQRKTDKTVSTCKICHERITRDGKEWVHSDGDMYCGTGDGAMALPEKENENERPQASAEGAGEADGAAEEGGGDRRGDRDGDESGA